MDRSSFRHALARGLSLVGLLSAIALSMAAVPVQALVGHTPGQFSVSAFGDAQYSIPLWSPPGTNGLGPNLALAYSSGNSNGWIGVGFSLPVLSSISRCNKTPAQDDPHTVGQPLFSTTDKFCIDGSRLRLTSGTTYGAAGTTYQTEVESFSQTTIEGVDGFGPTWFLVQRADGLIYEYGNTADSQIRLINGSGSLSAVRLLWVLNRIRDRSGNYIDFTYTQDPNRGGYYPQKIRWTGNLNGTAPQYEATFVNESADRPDVIFNTVPYTGTAGAIATFNYYSRLSQINISYVPTGSLVRQYKLAYVPGTGTGVHSVLQSVQECGVGGADCFAPTQFTWITASGTLTTGTSGETLPSGVTPFVMDIDGDGRDDLIWSSSATSGTGTWLYMLGVSGGGFGPIHNTGIANNGFFSAQKLEWDGDERADLIVPYSGGTWWVLRANGAGFDAPVNTGITAVFPTAFADINGDGRDDMVYKSSGLAFRLNMGSAFGAQTTSAVTFPFPIANIVPIATKGRAMRRRRQDFDGDGLEDLVLSIDHIDAVGNHDPTRRF